MSVSKSQIAAIIAMLLGAAGAHHFTSPVWASVISALCVLGSWFIQSPLSPLASAPPALAPVAGDPLVDQLAAKLPLK